MNENALEGELQTPEARVKQFTDIDVAIGWLQWIRPSHFILRTVYNEKYQIIYQMEWQHEE